MPPVKRGSVVERGRLQGVVWAINSEDHLVVLPISSSSDGEYAGDVGVGELEQRRGTNIRIRDAIIRCGRSQKWPLDSYVVGECPTALLVRIQDEAARQAQRRRTENSLNGVSAEVLAEFAEAARFKMAPGCRRIGAKF
jgi:hypothetical protein